MAKGMPNLREMLRRAAQLGCSLRRCKDGEILVWHPSQVRAAIVNSRRKDGTRALSTYLKRVERSLR